MTYPVPTIDHVVVNVRDRVDAGAETYRRLGFTLTPRGYHTLGSMNHLAMFGTDYLELIAAPPGDTRRAEILAAPEGLDGLVFATENADRTFAALEHAGVPVLPANDFSRPVTLPDGSGDAAFRTVRLAPGVVPSGRVYFCQHLTRDLVWRDEWRHHANGVTGVARVILVARDPAAYADVFARMFGPDAISDGRTLTAGLAKVETVTPDVFKAEFGDVLPDPPGRDAFMAGLVFHTGSLDAAWAAVQHAGARRQDNRIIVPPANAFGAMLAFQA